MYWMRKGLAPSDFMDIPFRKLQILTVMAGTQDGEEQIGVLNG